MIDVTIGYNEETVADLIDSLTTEYIEWTGRYGNIGDAPVAFDGMVGGIKMFVESEIGDTRRKEQKEQYIKRVSDLLSALK